MPGPRTDRAAALVPAALVLAAAVEAIWRGWGRPDWMTIGLLGSATTALVVLRRRHPLLAMTCFVAAALTGTLVQTTLPDPTSRTTSAFVPIIALLVLSYSLTAYGDRRAVLLGAPQPIVLVAAVDLLEPQAGSTATGVLFATVIVVAAPMLAGWLTFSRGQLLADLRRTEERLAQEHEERVRTARAQEVLRIWERLSTELSDGLAVVARTAGTGGARAAASVEATARGLLGRTRTTVVELSTAPDLSVAEPALDEPDRAPGVDSVPTENALPWAVLVASAVGLAIVLPMHDAWSAPLPAVLLCGLIVSGLAASWRYPLAGITLAWAAVVGYDRAVADLVSDQTLALPLLVVSTPFLVGWLERRGSALAGLMVCLTGALACAHSGDLLGAGVLAVLAWLGGRTLQSRVLLLEQVRRAHELLDRERDRELGAAVLEERATLARDVHDAVGHSLTVLALQAGAARRLSETDPAACAAAMATVAEVARDAAAQLDGSTSACADLDALLGRARRTGLQLTVSGDADLGSLSEEVRMLVHRIVQEALTNAMRHAPGAPVDVVIRRVDDHVTVRVWNGPPHANGRLAGSGIGLTALADRATAIGGRLAAGATAEGGFAVDAELPVRPVVHLQGEPA